MSARCSRSLAMATAWEPASPADSRSEGLWAMANWMSPCGAGQAQVGVEGLDRLHAEPHLLPRLVADHDPQVAGVGDLPHPAAPGVQAGQRDADRLVAERLEPGQATATGSGRASRRRWWCGRRTARPGRR